MSQNQEKQKTHIFQTMDLNDDKRQIKKNKKIKKKKKIFLEFSFPNLCIIPSTEKKNYKKYFNVS